MSERLLLKDDARSLCPTCCREISARIYEESSGVFMEKECPEHGPTAAKMESDPAVYRAMQSTSTTPRPQTVVVIPITHRCNLRCHMCFMPDDGVPDPSADAIKRMIDEAPADVLFSGGEPTVRKDLPDLISYAAKYRKNVCLGSNGIELGKKDVVSRLADAGLTHCLFSLNGLTDKTHMGIEGQPLANKKRQALENLVQSPITVIPSTTLMPGLNEQEILELINFFQKMSGKPYSWRIRTQAALGRHKEAPVYWMSDMLRIVCESWGADYEKLLKSVGDNCKHHGITHLFFNVRCHKDAPTKAIDARAQDVYPYRPPTPKREEKTNEKKGLIRRIREMISPPAKSKTKPAQPQKTSSPESDTITYGIRVFAWPDITNVDLDEVNQTGIWHIGPGGKAYPFVEAVIRNNHKPDWNW